MSHHYDSLLNKLPIFFSSQYFRLWLVVWTSRLEDKEKRRVMASARRRTKNRKKVLHGKMRIPLFVIVMHTRGYVCHGVIVMTHHVYPRLLLVRTPSRRVGYISVPQTFCASTVIKGWNPKRERKGFSDASHADITLVPGIISFPCRIQEPKGLLTSWSPAWWMALPVLLVGKKPSSVHLVKRLWPGHR